MKFVGTVRQVLAVVFVALAIPAGAAALTSASGSDGSGHAPDQRHAAAEGRAVDPTTVRVERTVEDPPGEVKWSFVSYRASDGGCLDMYAELVSEEAHGKVGSCAPGERRFEWGIGGVELGGTWYNVVYGRGRGALADVRIHLVNGNRLEADVVDETWIAVVPGDQFSFDVDRIEALDRSGSTVEVVEPPSIAAQRQQAQNGAAAIPERHP